MKKHLFSLVFAAAAACAIATRAQVVDPMGPVQLNFTVGLLTDASGAPVPDGSLVQIIAATSGSSFSVPSPTSFVGGASGDLILWQGAFNSSSVGIPGAMAFAVHENIFGAGGLIPHLKVGDPLLIRWFPLLSGTVIPAAPGVTDFGQYRATDWLPPMAWGVGTYHMITMSAGGDLANAEGAAQMTTGFTPVPEASSLAYYFAGGLLVVTLANARKAATRASLRRASMV